MRSLLSSTYFPFGSQYYRAPSPPSDDWDRDLRAMADLGFNTVKFWVQWRWNHPEPDRFYFDDIDRLMDLSDRHGLRVMLNTIVDVAPAWIYRQYPDASMRTRDGRPVGPQTQPHRQIGGLGWSFCHEAVADHMVRFLQETVRRYTHHPALEMWNVGSEPELTCSMAEMRLYADDAAKMGDMLDYNPHAVAAFRRWLADKYGTIDALNRAWNRNYRDFDDAEAPQTRNTFNDVVDWRMFFVDVLGANVRRRFEVAREEDEGRHPLLCHHVFVQGFPITSTANDPWNVGQYGDLHGFTQMDDPMMHDILRSCAHGKPVMSAEMLMLYGYTLNLPRPVDADDVKRHLFTGVAANLKGFIFWQYRPETLGREAPAWGLAHLDGAGTPALRAFAEAGDVLQRNAGFLLNAAPRPAEVALLYHPENQVFTWAATGNEKNATDSLLGAHRALYDRNLPIDFLHPSDFADGEALDRYRVIVLPFPYWLGASVAERLTAWVKAGGVLVAEAYCGGWDVEAGRHHTTLPGYGLHEVFGVRQVQAAPPDEQDFLVVGGAVRRAGHVSLRPGVNAAAGGFVAAQPVDPSGGLGRVEIRTTRALPGLDAGTLVYGALAKETLALEGADMLATFTDGTPAVTSHAYGAGRALLVGSYVALPYHRHGHPANAALLAGLVDYAAHLDRPRIVGGARVRVDVLTAADDGAMVIFQNNEPDAVDAVVRIPGLAAGDLTEQFGGVPLRAVPDDDGALVRLRLRPGEVTVYRT